MSIRVKNKYGDSGLINETPTKEELERKTIGQLLAICTIRRFNRNPFKKALINYILSLGELNI
jgi:hypothetical protein